MKDVVLKVTCSVEPLVRKLKVTPEQVEKAVVEAVEEALHYAEGRGFNHRLSDNIAIVVTGVDAQ